MHTKGPLTAEYSNVYKITENEDGKSDTWALVADCLSGIYTSYEEAKANAVLFSVASELLEALEDNNSLLLTLSRDALVREDYRATVVADQIRDNYESIRKAKGE